MKFVESKRVFTKRGMRNGSVEIMEMLTEFLQSGIEVAEVKDWEGTYRNAETLYGSLMGIVKRFFNGEIRASRSGQQVFIARAGK